MEFDRNVAYRTMSVNDKGENKTTSKKRSCTLAANKTLFSLVKEDKQNTDPIIDSYVECN